MSFHVEVAERTINLRRQLSSSSLNLLLVYILIELSLMFVSLSFDKSWQSLKRLSINMDISSFLHQTDQSEQALSYSNENHFTAT